MTSPLAERHPITRTLISGYSSSASRTVLPTMKSFSTNFRSFSAAVIGTKRRVTLDFKEVTTAPIFVGRGTGPEVR